MLFLRSIGSINVKTNMHWSTCDQILLIHRQILFPLWLNFIPARVSDSKSILDLFLDIDVCFVSVSVCLSDKPAPIDRFYTFGAAQLPRLGKVQTELETSWNHFRGAEHGGCFKLSFCRVLCAHLGSNLWNHMDTVGTVAWHSNAFNAFMFDVHSLALELCHCRLNSKTSWCKAILPCWSTKSNNRWGFQWWYCARLLFALTSTVLSSSSFWLYKRHGPKSLGICSPSHFMSCDKCEQNHHSPKRRKLWAKHSRYRDTLVFKRILTSIRTCSDNECTECTLSNSQCSVTIGFPTKGCGSHLLPLCRAFLWDSG